MNTLSFQILDSKETNDHEVRILIDGVDILGQDFMGIDPPDFFKQRGLQLTGEILIGRCICGVIGCGDYSVDVQEVDSKVIWSNDNGLHLEFDKESYLNLITTAKTDYSWENKYRRVERLTAAILKESKTIIGYSFDWSSARIKYNTITLSYSKDGQQKLFEIKWDGHSDQSAVDSANLFLAQL